LESLELRANTLFDPLDFFLGLGGTGDVATIGPITLSSNKKLVVNAYIYVTAVEGRGSIPGNTLGRANDLVSLAKMVLGQTVGIYSVDINNALTERPGSFALFLLTGAGAACCSAS
jgi:hypothetical protein